VASSSDVKGKKRAVESKLPQNQSSLAAASHPYIISKSSRKRMNRKQRENLVGGSLGAVGDALGGILGAGELDDEEEESEEDEAMEGTGRAKRRRSGKNKKDGSVAQTDAVKKIGEGKGRTLKEKQRKEQVYVLQNDPLVKQVTSLIRCHVLGPHRLASRAHVQAVLQNPAFKSNPFAAIRQHAANSLQMIDNKPPTKA
jgi:hypothetical protein